MKNLKKYNFLIVIFFIVIAGVFLSQNNNFSEKKEVREIKYVKIGEKIIKVELALTPEIQKQGLSGRENLKANEGMLFVFEKPQKNYFWMKDMNFPIDIIWMNTNQEIIYLKKNASPDLFPETYGPEEDSLYVLEVNGGFLEKNNVQEGKKIEFLP